MSVVVKLLIVHWFVSLFCQSFFLHRYSSHRMFKMNKFWEKFFYLMTYIAQGACFLNPRAYAILHTKHHQHSDTEMDPHSPIHSKNIFKMMIRTYQEYTSAVENKEQKDKYPHWEKLDRFALSSLNIFMWGGIYISTYFYLDIDIIYYPVLIIHFLMGPIHGALVNWFGHKVGYRNFSLKDNSKNTLPIDFLLMGEWYQNNHHKNGKKPNFATRFFEIDFTYQIMRVLVLVGIIKLKEKSNEIALSPQSAHF